MDVHGMDLRGPGIATFNSVGGLQSSTITGSGRSTPFRRAQPSVGSDDQSGCVNDGSQCFGTITVRANAPQQSVPWYHSFYFGEYFPGLLYAHHFPTREALKAYIGEGGMVFGIRPLDIDGMPFNFGGIPPTDHGFHQQLFWVDLSGLHNRSYFETGIGPDQSFPGNISWYSFGPAYHGLTVTPEILNPLGFSADAYNFVSHNCQDYCRLIYRSAGGH